MSELYVATLRRRQIRWKMRQSQHEWARPLPAEKCAIVCVRCFRTHTYSWPVALVYTNRMQRSGGRIGSTSHTALAYGSGLQHKHIIQIGKRKLEKKNTANKRKCAFLNTKTICKCENGIWITRKKKTKCLSEFLQLFFLFGVGCDYEMSGITSGSDMRWWKVIFILQLQRWAVSGRTGGSLYCRVLETVGPALHFCVPLKIIWLREQRTEVTICTNQLELFAIAAVGVADRVIVDDGGVARQSNRMANAMQQEWHSGKS